MCNFIDKRKSNKKAKEKKKNALEVMPVWNSMCMAITQLITPASLQLSPLIHQMFFPMHFPRVWKVGYQPRWFPNVLSLFSFNVKKWANYFGSDKDHNKKWLAKSWYRDHWHIKMEISSGTEAITMKNCYKYRQHFPLRF